MKQTYNNSKPVECCTARHVWYPPLEICAKFMAEKDVSKFALA